MGTNGPFGLKQLGIAKNMGPKESFDTGELSCDFSLIWRSCDSPILEEDEAKLKSFVLGQVVGEINPTFGLEFCDEDPWFSFDLGPWVLTLGYLK